jgi:signal peptidase I
VLVVVLVVVVAALTVKTFMVQAFHVPSAAMEDTLQPDDRVLVDKLTPRIFGLSRGDIVVFRDPGGWRPEHAPPDDGALSRGVHDLLVGLGVVPEDGGGYLVRRVIGLPGDQVMCCDGAGRIEVNSAPIDEPYLYPGDLPNSQLFSVTLPRGYLWVMGDHRSVAQVSRAHPELEDGMVPRSSVIGTAFVIVWPVERAWRLSAPPDGRDHRDATAPG